MADNRTPSQHNAQLTSNFETKHAFYCPALDPRNVQLPPLSVVFIIRA